jgi:hypothetical protein
MPWAGAAMRCVEWVGMDQESVGDSGDWSGFFVWIFFFSPSQGGYRKQASVSRTIMTPLGYMWERTKKNESWKKVYEKLNGTQGEQPSRLVHSKGGLLLNLFISPVRASISVVAKGGLGIVI